MAVITGDANDNVLQGLSYSDSVYGLDGNDTLSGSGDFYGGKGNDTYIRSGHLNYVNSGKGLAFENQNEGYDTLILNLIDNVQVVFTESPSIEEYIINGNPLFTGGFEPSTSTQSKTITLNATHTATYVDTGKTINPNTGLPLTYYINGAAGDDTIWGSIFNDSINGGAGADVMLGGKGDDIYEANIKSDVVIEMRGGGHDRINCTAKEYNLQINVEDLYVYGDKGAIGLNFNGNVGNNHIEITGNYDRIVKSWDGDDYISTAGGDDFLEGGMGNDTLLGGQGSDIYRSDLTGGKDVINDAGGAMDMLDLANVTPEQVWFTQAGNDLKIYNIDAPANSITMQNWFSDGNARIETIYSNGKSISMDRLDSLISAMSDFTKPNSSAENINPVITQAIQAAWH